MHHACNRLPERLGGGIVTVRLHSNDDDKQRKFNRAGNVRQIPADGWQLLDESNDT